MEKLWYKKKLEFIFHNLTKLKFSTSPKTEETIIIERKKRAQGYSCEMKDDLNITTKEDEIENWRTTKKLGSLIGVTGN